MSVVNEWVRGDSSVVRPQFPKQPSAAWRKGFNAGVAAMLVALARANKVSFPVHGARVFVFADHHVDDAEAACHAMLVQHRKATKRARARR